MSATPIPFPMVGSWTVRVKAVHPFLIHGDQYYELHVTRVGGPIDQVLAIKVPRHATAGQPQPGQTLQVTFLMGQVTQVTPK